jgi:ribonuclease J
VSVLYDQVAEVHVSGHACQEEIKTLLGLVQPLYYFPFHGEYKHLVKNAELAEYMGIKKSNITIPELGNVYELNKKGVKNTGTVPAGKVLVDGFGVGDVGSVVLRDRRHLSQDGIITVVAALSLSTRVLYSGPDIVSRGFVYVKESEALMDEARTVAANAIDVCLNNGGTSLNTLKNRVRDELSKFIYGKTKRKPMILPIIMDM